MAACLVARTGRELQRYVEGRRLVVGCIPYRFKTDEDGNETSEMEVMLISSQKGQKLMFPKGGWELDETKEDAAYRESIEEAGVRGELEEELGRWSFLSKRYGTYYEGYMFPLYVTEQLMIWPEMHVRQRYWMSVEEARKVCQHSWMKDALNHLVDRLSSPSSPKWEKHRVELAGRTQARQAS